MIAQAPVDEAGVHMVVADAAGRAGEESHQAAPRKKSERCHPDKWLTFFSSVRVNYIVIWEWGQKVFKKLQNEFQKTQLPQKKTIKSSAYSK